MFVVLNDKKINKNNLCVLMEYMIECQEIVNKTNLTKLESLLYKFGFTTKSIEEKMDTIEYHKDFCFYFGKKHMYRENDKMISKLSEKAKFVY